MWPLEEPQHLALAHTWLQLSQPLGADRLSNPLSTLSGLQAPQARPGGCGQEVQPGPVVTAFSRE